MAKTPDYQTSKAEWDGKLPFVYNMGALTSVNGTVEGQVFVAPCDCQLVDASYRIHTTLSNAAARLSLGTKGALTANLASVDVSAKTGLQNLNGQTFVSRNFNKGDAIVMSLVNADTTGVISASATFMPR